MQDAKVSAGAQMARHLPWVMGTATALGLLFPGVTSAQPRFALEPKEKTPALMLAAASPAGGVPLPPPPRGTRLIERPDSPTWTTGASIGPMFSLGSAATSFGLRLEASRPLKPLSPTVELQLFVPFTIAYWGKTSSIGIPGFPTMSQTTEAKALWLAAVPCARFAFQIPRAPRLGLYADGGLGITAGFAKTTTDQMFTGRNIAAENSVGAVIRLAGSASYAVTDKLRIDFEPIGLDFHIGSGSSTWTLLVGAAWRV